MVRRFHSYGPVEPSDHFFVPRSALIERCVNQLIGNPDRGGHFFTIWGPRQTGKTWIMRQAQAQIQKVYGERFVVGVLSMQGLMNRDQTERDFLPLVPGLFQEEMELHVPVPADFEVWRRLFLVDGGIFDRPLILMIDEFDDLPSVVIDRLVRLFRKMFLSRQSYRLHSLALVGVRAVLGADSERGSPFNVQRSLHVPNLTKDEVIDMFAQCQRESGQRIDPEVVDKVYEVTRGQPGLVGWLGELLTEKYNPGIDGPISLSHWPRIYEAACKVEPNNTVLNLLKKARQPACREHVVSMFRQSNIPFSFDEPWCNYLYTHGIIDQQEVTGEAGEISTVCRFSSPFVQLRLYSGFTADMAELGGRVPVLDPRDDVSAVLLALDLPVLLGRYRDYLKRLHKRGINPWAGQPRRSDLHLTEAVGHFHLYWWLIEAVGRQCVISPEFPTGNGKVDLHIRCRGQQGGWQLGLIEVKSFTTRADLPLQKRQAAGYAKSRDLSRAALALFVPSDDDDLMDELSGSEAIVIDGAYITIDSVAISAV